MDKIRSNKNCGWDVSFDNTSSISQNDTSIITEKRILDSGNRRDFGTGAVRDAATGKGRFDLTPLDVIGKLISVWEDSVPEELSPETVLTRVSKFMAYGDERYLFEALINLSAMFNKEHIMNRNGIYNLISEFAKHTEEGCNKYGDTIKDENDPNFGKVSPNMMKGIPVHCYIDSGVRHFLKYLAGKEDEPHDRATIWNFIMGIWTKRHIPDLDDIHHEVFAGRRASKNEQSSNRN